MNSNFETQHYKLFTNSDAAQERGREGKSEREREQKNHVQKYFISKTVCYKENHQKCHFLQISEMIN
jgi:hypothetical protein